MNMNFSPLVILAPILVNAFAALAFAQEENAPPKYEVIRDYRPYIAGSGDVVAWYGERVALVLDDDPNPEKRNPKTMAEILGALDDTFDAFDRVTGRRPKLTAPLKGKIRIEVSSKVGGGLAHHGRLGVGIGDGFFKGLYKRFENGERTVDQVFFYEIARNYWMANMNPTIDYHTSKGPRDYGWWTVGFNNAMSIFLPAEIDSIKDMYYFGSDGKKFSDGMEANINTYIQNPKKYNWENSWNVPLLPWKERTSVNDLMTGLLIRLHRDHGGIDFINRLYKEIPKRKPLESRADRQGARNNFYEAASIAARKDLYDFFSNELRWKITVDREQLRHSIALAVVSDMANPKDTRTRRSHTYSEESTFRAQPWSVVDIRFEVKKLPESPIDVTFSASMVHESEKRIEASGFFDGDAYVIRFTPRNSANGNSLRSRM